MRSAVIVDDHPAIRVAVRSALESSGIFTVVGEADNGPEALGVIREHRPALAILDLCLPKMHGLELIERLRASQPGTRLLVLSAQKESVFASRALRAGAHGFLSKCEGMNAIVQASNSVLSGYGVFPNSALDGLSRPREAESVDPLACLTDRELAVLQHLARGMSNKEVGEAMLISNKTVSSCKTRILEKLNISTLMELVDFARAHDIAG